MSSAPIPENQPSEFVNTWKPVTEAYQDAEAPTLNQPVQPLPTVEKPVTPVKKRVTDGLPLSLVIFGWFYMVRAAVYLVFAFILFSQPDSGFGAMLVQYSSFLVPFRMHRVQGAIPIQLFAEALLVTAIFSVVIGGMWLARYWRIRWVTMCYAGGSAARTLIYMITGAIGAITPDQKQALLAGCAINLLIFCYLAFYPGVEQAFEGRL